MYANRSTEDFLGYSASQIQDMGSGLLAKLLHPEDANRVAQHHARFCAVSDRDVLECTYRMRRSDGQWRWLHSRDVLFARDARGELAVFPPSPARTTLEAACDYVVGRRI